MFSCVSIYLSIYTVSKYHIHLSWAEVERVNPDQHVYIYIYMCIYIYIYIHVCMYLYLYVSIYVQFCIYLSIYIYHYNVYVSYSPQSDGNRLGRSWPVRGPCRRCRHIYIYLDVSIYMYVCIYLSISIQNVSVYTIYTIYIYLSRTEIDRVNPDQHPVRVGAVNPNLVHAYI